MVLKNGERIEYVILLFLGILEGYDTRSNELLSVFVLRWDYFFVCNEKNNNLRRQKSQYGGLRSVF